MGLRIYLLRKRTGTLTLMCLVASLLGCAVTTRLAAPLPIKNFGEMKDETIGLYVSDASRTYVWNGHINVAAHHVEFGNALEPNAKHALSRIFRKVVVLDKFPPNTSAHHDLTRAVSVEIKHANVTPGALTFSSSSAQLDLTAVVAHGGRVEGNSLLVQGRAEASPGIMGAIGPLYSNQTAYYVAIQKAAELAMVNALEQLVDLINQRDKAMP